MKNRGLDCISWESGKKKGIFMIGLDLKLIIHFQLMNIGKWKGKIGIV